ncbi:hypothetical protein V1525DRAFT_83714 [Lipomyces kononenkoae]|uniref:Uncharacterized protein n=1 Tax=Lipomyces kononenkoae TaxID=34357 RepID=A0ACC3SSJ5_LIPKO
MNLTLLADHSVTNHRDAFAEADWLGLKTHRYFDYAIIISSSVWCIHFSRSPLYHKANKTFHRQQKVFKYKIKYIIVLIIPVLLGRILSPL